MHSKPLLLVALVLGACAQPETLVEITPQAVDGSFAANRVALEEIDALQFSYRTFEDAGKVAVCGVRLARGSIAERAENEAVLLPTLRLELAGKVVLAELDKFPTGNFEADSGPSGLARCFRTDIDWADAYADATADVVSRQSAAKIQQPATPRPRPTQG